MCASVGDSHATFDVVVLGSGGPAAAGRAASSTLVRFEGTPRILVDVGPGTFARLGEARVDLTNVDTILLTHLHVDHAGDLAGVVKARDVSSNDPLVFTIVGPGANPPYPSTDDFVKHLFGDVFGYLPKFRNPIEFRNTPGPGISSTPVDHDDVPALAYRIDYKGHAVVVTGDLASKNDNVAQLARDADVLIYDTSVLDPPGSPEKLYDLHTAPKRIGEIASAAHVRRLVLAHLTPQVERNADAVLKSVKSTFRGDVTFAEDCMVIRVAP